MFLGKFSGPYVGLRIYISMHEFSWESNEDYRFTSTLWGKNLLPAFVDKIFTQLLFLWKFRIFEIKWSEHIFVEIQKVWSSKRFFLQIQLCKYVFKIGIFSWKSSKHFKNSGGNCISIGEKKLREKYWTTSVSTAPRYLLNFLRPNTVYRYGTNSCECLAH